MRTMKTLWPLGAAALALGLNGCGGGGNTRPAPAERTAAAPAPPPEEEEMEMSHLLIGEAAKSAATALESVVIGNGATPTATRNSANANNFTIGTSPNELDVIVTRTGEGPMVKAIHTGTDGGVDAVDADNPDDTPLMMAERKAPAAGNLHAARFEDEDEMHYLNVYTDIRAPVPKPFEEVHPLNAHTDADDAEPLEALTIVSAGHASLVDSGDEHSRPNTVYSYAFDKSATEDVDEAESFPGTLQGASGTFRCDGSATCTVTTDTNRVLMFSDGWIFIPAPMAMAMVLDDDFLTFGYWTQIPTDGDWTFRPFSIGSMEYAISSVTNVEGSARYVGSAAGGYAKRQYDSEGVAVPDTDEAGEFTAAVTLMAHFGGGRVPANDQFTIRGTVSDFVNADGGSLDGWTVTLDPADFSGRTGNDWPTTASAPGSSHANNFDGTTSSTPTGDAGSWRGSFYGPSQQIDPDGTPGNDDDYYPKPTGVAGEFDASFSNGEVVGAFGATRQ